MVPDISSLRAAGAKTLCGEAQTSVALLSGHARPHPHWTDSTVSRIRAAWLWWRQRPLSVRVPIAIGVLIAFGMAIPVIRAIRSPEGLSCRTPLLNVVASTDRDRYHQEDKVILSTTVRNASSQPCLYITSAFAYTIETASGRSLGGGASHSDRGTREPLALTPGEGLTEVMEWDQRNCLLGPDRCSRAAPGTYVARITWTFDGAPIKATRSFELLAPP